MARIEIKNARVNRIIRDRGFEVAESYQTRNGDTVDTKYTVWTKSPQDIPGEGVTVNVRGNVSTRLEEFTNNEGEQIRFARMHVNQPEISMIDTPPAPEPWANQMNTEAPF